MSDHGQDPGRSPLRFVWLLPVLLLILVLSALCLGDGLLLRTFTYSVS